jgi:tetratricopeptide (TPR) repeat protein
MTRNCCLALGRLTSLLVILVLAIPTVAQLDRWNDLVQRATQLIAQGRAAEALPVAKEALSVAESTFGTAHVNYGISQNGLGYVLMLMGNLDDAEAQFLAAKTTIGSAVGAENPNMLYPLANLAQLYYTRATASQSNPQAMPLHLAKAESYGRTALTVCEKNFGPDDIKVAQYLEGLAFTFSAEKKFSDARDVLQRSLRIEKANLPADNVQIIRTENEMAWVSEQTGNRVDAQQMYQTALASAQKTLGDQDPMTASIRENLGRLSSNGSASSGGVQGNFFAALKQVIEGSANRFDALKGARQSDEDGDHLWTPTIVLPGAKECTIWNYHERDLGSTYVCHYDSYPNETAAVQDYNNMKQAVAQFLGPQWTVREKDANNVRFTNSSYGLYVRLNLKDCDSKQCTLSVWVGSDR